MSRKSLIDGKDDARKQAAAAEKAREAAVEEVVARGQRQVEESVSETYRCFEANHTRLFTTSLASCEQQERRRVATMLSSRECLAVIPSLT